MLTLEALRRGGGLIVPLMLVSIAVASIVVDRLRFCWHWGRDERVSPERSLSELDQLEPSQASARQQLLLERLLPSVALTATRWSRFASLLGRRPCFCSPSGSNSGRRVTV